MTPKAKGGSKDPTVAPNVGKWEPGTWGPRATPQPEGLGAQGTKGLKTPSVFRRSRPACSQQGSWGMVLCGSGREISGLYALHLAHNVEKKGKRDTPCGSLTHPRLYSPLRWQGAGGVGALIAG